MILVAVRQQQAKGDCDVRKQEKRMGKTQGLVRPKRTNCTTPLIDEFASWT